MSYSPLTDFLALLRQTSGGVRSERMPGLDYVVAALARAGLISISVGQTAPTVNPATTVWFQPAVPSWTAEGAVFLWNAAVNSYQVATPTLWSSLIAGPFVSLIPAPGGDLPLMDGNAAPGASPLYSREDHIHPTDTSRAPLASPTFTGTPAAPTPTIGDNTTKVATTAFVIANGGLPPPVGSILPYAGGSAPNSSWQIAVGQAVSRTGTTAALFAALGIAFGSGDGVTTFNLPDLRGRIVAGVDGGANRLTTATMSSQALAGVGGGETQTLTITQIPAHAHGVTDPTHTHVFQTFANTGSSPIAAASSNISAGPNAGTLASATGISIQNNGSGGSHPNVQPTMELNYIIRVS